MAIVTDKDYTGLSNNTIPSQARTCTVRKMKYQNRSLNVKPTVNGNIWEQIKTNFYMNAKVFYSNYNNLFKFKVYCTVNISEHLK